MKCTCGSPTTGPSQCVTLSYCHGDTPLLLAARGGHTTCVEHLLSTPGIDVNIKNRVTWSNAVEGIISA